MARRADHTRDELKTMIMDAAWTIVGRDGFEGLTARGIAAEIGYAPGTIYNIFDSMDDLYLQLNGRTLDALFEDLCDETYHTASNALMRNLKAMAARYAAFANKRKSYWLMLFEYKLPEGQPTPAWYQEKIDRIFVPLEDLLRPLFTAQKALEAKIAARTLWASLHGLCLLQATGKVPLPDGKSAEDMRDYLIETFVKGIKQ